MHTLHITGIFLVVVLTAGCSSERKVAPADAVRSEPQVSAPSPVEPPPTVTETIEPAPIEVPAPVEPKQEEVIATEPPRPEVKPGAAVAPAPRPTQSSTPKVVAAAPAMTEPAPVAPAPSPVNAEVPAPPVTKPPEPTLDVVTLKERLKETKAIGVFTKLALKNQVDDLMKQFQAHYQARQKSDLATLRQAYNMLVLKVLSLIQDGDPSLARTIVASREAIWGILADPIKFKTLM